MPGSRSSLRQMSSCLFACASSSVVVSSCPHRAGVGERRPEHHPVEVVGDVVVVRDGGGVALARVAPAVHPRLLGRRRERLQPLPPDELGGSHDLPGPEPQLLDVLGDGHHVEDVAVDLELAGDVGAPEPQLVGRGDDAAEGIRGAHHDRRAGIGRPEARPVVGPERDRHLVAEHVGQEIRNAHDHPLSSGASHGGHRAIAVRDTRPAGPLHISGHEDCRLGRRLHAAIRRGRASPPG